MPDWELLLRFDTDDAEFARGFEAARLYERARSDHTTWTQAVHASNAEMVLRIAEATDREFSVEYEPDRWECPECGADLAEGAVCPKRHAARWAPAVRAPAEWATVTFY